ncbi:hypothetical protein LguiA_000529 [Lonicera macranthoides]
MSSTRNRNFRRRAGDDEDDDKDTTTDTPAPSSTTTKKPQSKPPSAVAVATTTKPKKPPHHQAPKNLLSFADDEETPISRPKSKPPSSSSRLSKPSHSTSSHKLTPLKDRIHPSSPSTPLPSNVQPQAGTYTKEALLELQKNTKTLAPSRPSQPPSEPVIVLKGLVKPAKQVEEFEEDEDDKASKSSSANDATIRMNSLGLGKSRDSIPDQATINAIRAKRERLRQARAAAPDYIAIDGGSNHGEAEGLSDEEPEFQGRIAMFGEKKEDSGKKGVFEDIDERPTVDVVGIQKDVEVVGGDDEDEEDKIWEEEQFRKGLGKRMDDGSSNRVGTSSVPVVHQQKNMYPPAQSGYSTGVAIGPGIGGAFGSLPGLDGMSISQQAEVSRKALLENVRRLKESHGRTVALLTRTDENLTASLLNVTALENSLSAAGEKFIFMQKLREFVSVVCDFLQDKAPLIEELEYQMQKLHEERAEAISERRAADNNDEMLEVGPAVNAAMAVLDKGGNNASVVEAARIAAQAAAAAARESRNLPVKLDEFGRDENLQKRMDMERRAEARKRRKARSDSKRMSSMTNDGPYHRVEGESSTDESDSESTAYKSNHDELLQTAGQVFSDAAEEYSQLSVVKERFERWKKDYASSYNDAYMSLSVPDIFSPYVRLELLKWDPLHEDSDFFDMKWHSLLFDYGLTEDENKMSEDDADANLIPELVEKVAIPILHHEIAHCWDILSTRETKCAVSATNLVCRYVRPSSKALGKLVTELRERLARAVDDMMVPTWSTLVMKAVPDAARVAAYRFGMSVRLLKNICLWNEILSMSVLEKLALDELLTGKVIPHLRSILTNVHDAVTRTERIIASISGVWAGPSVTADRSPKLQPLVDYLLMLGRTLEKKHVSGGGEGGGGSHRLARRLKKLLVELNEYDHARAISRTFNLKEAL